MGKQTATAHIDAEIKTLKEKLGALTGIRAKNAAYAKASKAQRKVMICKDALEQIKAKRFIPTRGIYAKTNVEALDPAFMSSYPPPLQPALFHPWLECKVCARGGLFLSAVRLANRYNGAPMDVGPAQMDPVMLDAFTRAELDEIEKQFEWTHEKCSPYYGMENNERLTAMLKRIIKDKGVVKKVAIKNNPEE